MASGQCRVHTGWVMVTFPFYRETVSRLPILYFSFIFLSPLFFFLLILLSILFRTAGCGPAIEFYWTVAFYRR